MLSPRSPRLKHRARPICIDIAKRLNPRQRNISTQSEGQQPRSIQKQPYQAASSNSFVTSTHKNFKLTEASRPNFVHTVPITTTKTPSPGWRYGDGINLTKYQHTSHIEIDPSAPDRNFISNYKLLISGIPRPISFVSTISADGTKTNLAPFSYFQVVDHDPAIIVIGFSARKDRLKDTRRNLIDTGECVISVVSEHMIEAVNGTSLELPHGISEWELSGLLAADSTTVRPKRVKDAVFSMEGKLLEMKPLDYGHAPGEPHGALAIIECTRFWVRSDAINEQHDHVDLDKLRPLVQLGGISYGRINQTFELPRPGLTSELNNESKGLHRFIENDTSGDFRQKRQEEAPEVQAKMGA